MGKSHYIVDAVLWGLLKDWTVGDRGREMDRGGERRDREGEKGWRKGRQDSETFGLDALGSLVSNSCLDRPAAGRWARVIPRRDQAPALAH